jgi:hypothetical protein
VSIDAHVGPEVDAIAAAHDRIINGKFRSTLRDTSPRGFLLADVENLFAGVTSG